jgi:hypothetical protein
MSGPYALHGRNVRVIRVNNAGHRKSENYSPAKRLSPIALKSGTKPTQCISGPATLRCLRYMPATQFVLYFPITGTSRHMSVTACLRKFCYTSRYKWQRIAA